MQTFKRPTEGGPLPIGPWREYRKTAITSACRIEGPFRVETSEGPLTCKDGYLCIDSRGYPYPVAKDEFESIYEPETDFSWYRHPPPKTRERTN